MALHTFTDWAQRHYDGNEALALAYCSDALEQVLGAEWDGLPEEQCKQLLQAFTGWLGGFRTDQDDVYGLAAEFVRRLYNGEFG